MLIAKEITPALTKIHDAAEVAEKPSSREGVPHDRVGARRVRQPKRGRGCGRIALLLVDEAMKQLDKLGKAKGVPGAQ